MNAAHKITHLIFIIFVTILMPLKSIYAETLNVGFYNFAPFMMQKNGKISGIYKDVLMEIAKITGDEINITMYPYARLEKEYQAGRVSIEPGVSPAWKVNSTLKSVYTQPFSKLVNILLFNEGGYVAVDINNPEKSLKGRTIGTVNGYYYANLEALFKNKKAFKFDVLNEENLIKILDKNRVNQIVINKDIATYFMLENPKYRRFVIGDAVENTDIRMMVHPNKKHIVERMDKAITQLINTGVINKIYARYQFSQ